MGTITILPETTVNPITLIGKRAGICWGSDISNDEANYKRGMGCITANHGRTLEFVNVETVIDGYSARVIREWYTHIGGSPTRLQASTRYIDYTKGGLEYVVPKSIAENEEALERYASLMRQINDGCASLEREFGVPREDSALCLPLGMTTKIVDKRNLRNLVDMSHQRMCSRAYHEYRQLFTDLTEALNGYSEEWRTVTKLLFVPKCEIYGYCPEKKSCGRKAGRN